MGAGDDQDGYAVEASENRCRAVGKRGAKARGDRVRIGVYRAPPLAVEDGLLLGPCCLAPAHLLVDPCVDFARGTVPEFSQLNPLSVELMLQLLSLGGELLIFSPCLTEGFVA